MLLGHHLKRELADLHSESSKFWIFTEVHATTNLVVLGNVLVLSNSLQGNQRRNRLVQRKMRLHNLLDLSPLALEPVVRVVAQVRDVSSLVGNPLVLIVVPVLQEELIHRIISVPQYLQQRVLRSLVF